MTLLVDTADFSTQMPSNPAGVAEASVFRPIQYLGSKLRTIDALVESTRHLFGPGDRVFDVFSGSSVVSQALASAGGKVTAIDASASCGVLAKALLGVERSAEERCAAHAQGIANEINELGLPPDVDALLRNERRAKEDVSGRTLAAFSRSVPQVWRDVGGNPWLKSVQPGLSGFDAGLLVTSHYAGTYFGVEQAIKIDRIRCAIEQRRRVGAISTWIEAALITALLSAMSRAVFSAGKHFAQPMLERKGKNDAFYLSRLKFDRSICVVEVFLDAAAQVDALAKRGGHSVLVSPIEQAHGEIIAAKPALVYADPPYTAQQYSRFYHVLDVVSEYRAPYLQRINGEVTKGLYGEGRFKSPFSSKRSASGALEQIIKTAKESGASLAISYSCAAGGSTGNARMIGLEELKALCSKHYGRRVNEIWLDHAYRQFNSARLSKVDRKDPEVLLVGEA